MPGPGLADPIAAGSAVLRAGGDGLEDRAYVWPGLGRPAGHDGRSAEGAFFTTGHAGADVELAVAFDVFGAAGGIGIVGVAAVDQDVAFFQQGQELLDELVDGCARLDHQHDFPRTLQGGTQFGKRMRADDFQALAAAVYEIIHLGRGAVEDRDGASAAFHVQHQVLTHDRQADQADICVGHRIVPSAGCSFTCATPAARRPCRPVRRKQVSAGRTAAARSPGGRPARHRRSAAGRIVQKSPSHRTCPA